jgi:hypothetical protein
MSALRERKHGLLWFGSEPKDRWNITDPSATELYEAASRLRPRFNLGAGDERTPEEKRRDSDLFTVLRCVEDYQHLTTYALGIEHVIKKLRAIWRALREAETGRKRSDGQQQG